MGAEPSPKFGVDDPNYGLKKKRKDREQEETELETAAEDRAARKRARVEAKTILNTVTSGETPDICSLTETPNQVTNADQETQTKAGPMDAFLKPI